MYSNKLDATTRDATNDEWDTIWANCSYANYYQSREWAEVWSKYKGGITKPAPVLIYFSDDKKIILPFSKENIIKKGMFYRYVTSVPSGRPGGGISSDILDMSHAYFIYNFMRNNYANVRWNMNPLDAIVDKLNIPKIPGLDIHLIELCEDFDVLYKNIARKQRGAINKAVKAGINIRTASTIEDWRKLYLVYEDSIRRWGKDAVFIRKWKIYELLFYLKSPHIKVWIAEYNGEVIGGMLCFFSKGIVSPWLIVTMEEYFPLRPASLLYYTLIKYSCEKGYGWIDLGRSGNRPGLIKFKERFGAIPVKSFRYEHYSVYIPVLNFIRSNLSRLNKYFNF